MKQDSEQMNIKFKYDEKTRAFEGRYKLGNGNDLGVVVVLNVVDSKLEEAKKDAKEEITRAIKDELKVLQKAEKE